MPVVIFTLKAYLNKMSAMRRGSVPTQEELAKACGLEPANFSKMVNNRTAGPKRATLAALIKELRRRGFEVDFNDLFEYVE